MSIFAGGRPPAPQCSHTASHGPLIAELRLDMPGNSPCACMYVTHANVSGGTHIYLHWTFLSVDTYGYFLKQACVSAHVPMRERHSSCASAVWLLVQVMSSFSKAGDSFVFCSSSGIVLWITHALVWKQYANGILRSPSTETWLIKDHAGKRSFVGISNQCRLLNRSETQIVTNIGYYLGLVVTNLNGTSKSLPRLN